MTSVLKINDTDFTELLQTEYSVERIEQTKNVRTNAMGDTTFTRVHPKYKVYATFLPSDEATRHGILSAIESYIVSLTFRCPYTASFKTITCYASCDKNTYRLLKDNLSLLDSVEIRFIEL